jgi:hypothetical protein
MIYTQLFWLPIYIIIEWVCNTLYPTSQWTGREFYRPIDYFCVGNLSLFILSPSKVTHFLGETGFFCCWGRRCHSCVWNLNTSPSYNLWPWWWSQQTSYETPARQSAAIRCSHLKLGSTGLILLLSYKRVWHHKAAAILANRLERISPSKIKCMPLLCLMTLWNYGIVWWLWRMSKCIRSVGGTIVTGENWSAWRQHCPSVTLSTTSPAWLSCDRTHCVPAPRHPNSFNS